MVLKKTISFFSELGETTFYNGMNTTKSVINRIHKLTLPISSEGRFEGLLKRALTSYDVLKKESITKLKNKFLSKNIKEDSESTFCSTCGLTLPSYYIFCICCGAQLFDDIFELKSSKSIKILLKSINHLLDSSILLNNLKLLLFLYKRFDKYLFSLTGWDNRV